MTDRTMPSNATDWAQFLIEKPLPSPFRVGKQVLQSMQVKKMPYSKIASQINSDPVLSCYTMNAANKGRAEEKTSSKTLDHAISMIGVEQLEQIIHELPFQDPSSTDIKSFYYIRTLCRSLYAAHLGRAISLKKSWGNPEEIYWASLFMSVPLWYLWRHATPEMRLIRYAIRSNFKLPETAEREVLGGSILELATTLVEQLDLPDLVNSCYDKANQLSPRQWVQVAHSTDDEANVIHRIKDKSLTITLQSSGFIVMLANLVAHYATHDWYSRACLRSQRVLASYLHIPLSDAVSLTHRAAAEMSRSHPLPGVMLPAAKLFVAPRKRTRAKAASETPAIEAPTIRPEVPITETTHQSPETDKGKLSNPIFDELTEIMLNRPEEFTDLHELMNAATQGLAYGIDLKRATVYLINNDGSRIKAYYHVGSRDQSEFSEFTTKLVPNTIFSKLVERSASIWVKPSSDEKIANLIPMNFKQVIEVEEFFLMSVFVNKRPVAIFYGDNYHGDALSDDQYKQFKFMCSAVSKALQNQADRKS